MDLGFLRRAEKRFASRNSTQPDFGMLRVMLAAQASASPAAKALAQCGVRRPFVHPLAEIVLAGPCWRQAAMVQAGCFYPPALRQDDGGKLR